jgi:hypothetical protein
MARRPGTPEQDPVDALYALPFEEFIAARNRLAAETAKAGDRARAAEIKGLAKPSLSAWVANQIYWHDRALYDALEQAVAAARHASGNELRGALEARRQALVAAGRRASEILAHAGSPASPETLRRVASTLEAVTTLPPGPEIQPGRLVRDVDPPGFDALAGWGPRAVAKPSPTARVLEFKPGPGTAKTKPPSAAEARRQAAAEAQRQAALEAARAAVRAAEQALAAARREAQRAERAAAKARAEADAAERERGDLESRLAKVTAAAQTSAREARDLERQAGATALAARQAEMELARARGKIPPE